MYQVLYRKWRPQTFSDVSGQNHITTTLKNEIMSGRLAHAYLFTGSRGTGKTTCAKILAKAVNCLHPKDGDPCNECEICKGIDAGTVLDISEIDAASNNGVDNIRALREEVHFTPTAGRYRVYIIDEVHMLSTGAFNALLKTLEEPPEHVIFVLATTEVHKVPATVLSRCQRFDFHRISSESIAARLQYVAAAEAFALTEEAGLLIARLADGGLRDALSILDRCAGVPTVDVDRVNEIVGLAGLSKLFALSDAMASGDVAKAFQTVEALYNGATDMSRLCDQLIVHFRSIMLAKSVPNCGGLLNVSGEELRRFMNAAEGFELSVIFRILQTLQDTALRLRTAGDSRVELEIAILSLMQPAVPVSQPVSVPEQSVKPTSKPQPKEEIVPPWEEQKAIARAEDTAEKYREELTPPPFDDADVPPEEAVPVAPPAQPKAPRDGLPYFAQWPQVIAAVGKVNRMMGAVLKGSDAFEKGDLLLIRSENPQFIDLIRVPANRGVVKEAVQAVCGKTYRLGPYKPEEESGPPQDPFQALLKDLNGKVPLQEITKTNQQ